MADPSADFVGKWLQPPKFALGQKVWLRAGSPENPEHYEESEVLSYALTAFSIPDDGVYLRLIGYNTKKWKLPFVNPSPWPECDVFSSEDEAKIECAFLRVALSPDVWIEAAGLNHAGERMPDFEESELGICCAMTSEIRDMLGICVKQGGLNHTQRTRLQTMLDDHNRNHSTLDQDNIKVVLNALK